MCAKRGYIESVFCHNEDNFHYGNNNELGELLFMF